MTDKWRVAYDVPGDPVAQPRPRFTSMKGGGGRAYTPTKHPVNAYKKKIQLMWPGGKPITGAVALTIQFTFALPKSQEKKRNPLPRQDHTKKPDLDNCLKAVKDALNGLAWKDDAQVCYVEAFKDIAPQGEPGCTKIEVRNCS